VRIESDSQKVDLEMRRLSGINAARGRGLVAKITFWDLRASFFCF